ncbi:hypothetical protein BN3662_00634 [Clostridiales bacterium CHKCI006]|uniref:Uncharacterized protein n=1 Tax=Candidatus Fimiplasma intestinipullorum TaxID=2840825 RepID=A0A9D1L0X2_9FIRM|nr:hypothetical protein BN3662_00634 [Clostridiales bacterium CHKCI006]HIU13511.1 hypothetical protein [Candidatus Fimiplasma intestinipullorum]
MDEWELNWHCRLVLLQSMDLIEEEMKQLSSLAEQMPAIWQDEASQAVIDKLLEWKRELEKNMLEMDEKHHLLVRKDELNGL